MLITQSEWSSMKLNIHHPYHRVHMMLLWLVQYYDLGTPEFVGFCNDHVIVVLFTVVFTLVFHNLFIVPFELFLTSEKNDSN